MKVKILIDDPLGRWKKGEIGIVLKNDFPEYAWYLKLPGTIKVNNFLGKGSLDAVRQYYFYTDEVEEVK